MAGYPNAQNNPAGAIPVWTVMGFGVGGQAYLGFEQVADLTAAEGLTVPLGTTLAIVMPEDGNVRWKSGADPTGLLGMPIWGTSTVSFAGTKAVLEALRFINMTASTSKLSVVYYGIAP